LTTLYPILFGLLGAAAGIVVHSIVGRFAPAKSRVELVITIAFSVVLAAGLRLKYENAGSLYWIYFTLGLVLIGTGLFDSRTQTIPHGVTLPGLVAGVVIATFMLPIGFAGSMVGMLVGGSVLLISTIVEALRKKEIGGGDWKYAAMIGSFLGGEKMVTALIFTGVFGVLASIVLHLSNVREKPRALGPWLSAGAIASILWNR
jgi:prepilin signal peptidase PulO-like enzyme (type II secretory pathway)